MAKILIIDDDKNVLEEFRNVLLDEGHDAQTASSGEDAIRLCKESSFDLAFLDVQMPKMQGMAVLDSLRQIRRFPVIMMSGFLPLQKEAEIMERGAEICLRKPLDIEKIRQLIQSIVNHRSE